MDWKARIPAVVLWLALLFSSIEDGEAEHRVVCYYTNWSVYRPGTAKFSPQNINPYLCTHLIYAFGGFTKDNTLKPFDKYQDIEKGGYAKFTGLKTYNKNLKTMLAIGGWNEGSSRFSPMVADPGRRKEFVKNSVKFLRQNHFDGLDLDWEYPAFRDGGKPRDRNNYADLVQELREEFERESSKTGRPRLLLSMAVPAGIEYIDKGYDIPRLNDYLDFINLLSYDYHSAFEPAVNHHAPLYPLEEDNEYNYDTELTIDYSIKHLLKSGASSEKIVLGIPTYGRSYTLINEDATDIGAPADGPGEEGDATREKGYLAYYEICENIAKSDEWEVVQPNPSAMGPYAFRQNQWVGYDDEDIVRAKSRYVIENKLGGIMFWSIDNDDFRGKCHGRPYPLIEAAKEEMLAGSERVNTRQKTKLSDNRKKTRTQGGQRIQGNTIGRKLTAGNRRTTTQAAASRKRISSTRPNARSNTRGNSKVEDSDEEVEDDEEEVNIVKAVEKPRPRTRSKSRSKNRAAGGGRRKSQQNSRHTEEENDSEKQESLSSSFTTPEPPTTPDPGSDFKCEDEGFFSHPRDCKKYFWCLDSGPGGLGIVGHQFTCPSGLVFNKAADSCDYPRNVVCPKKTSQSAVTTTRAPITAATARTTYLHKPTKRTTTAKPEVESEEYEYYDDEEEELEEAEEEPRTTSTSKPLQYKTINRSRPTTTTSVPSTTTTEAAIAASTKSYKSTPDRVASFEDEEDPRVLKELIELIKKAGGIEQLEKQLNFQEKNSGGSSDKNESNGKSTPATISRSLYERVLSRQATRIAGSFLGSLSSTESPNGDRAEQRGTKNARTGFVNGPGGAQFEGLDNVPEVKSLRRTNKPKYVTIERHRSSTSESPAEEEEEDEETADDDNTDVASSEDRAVSNPPQQRTTSRRVTPSYVNIRRPRPSTTTSENDVEVKDEDSNDDPEDEEEEEEAVTQRHRVVNTEVESSGPKSRYTNVNRFRSTTSRNNEVDQLDEISERNEITTESTTTTTTTTTTEKIIPVTEEKTEAPIPSTTSEPSTLESFPASTLEPSSTESSAIPPITDSPVKLVEESATEILLTTAPASSSPGSSTESFTRGGTTVSAVSQPRPFGFPRRGRPTTPAATSSAVTEQSRPKVDSEAFRLPTLKELVGFSTTPTESVVDLSPTFTPSTKKSMDTMIDDEKPRDERVDRPKNLLQDLIQDPLDEDNEADENDAREVDTSSEQEIYDNDVLGSEEIQRRSFSSSFATAGTENAISTIDAGGNNDTSLSKKRVEVPVTIGPEENQRNSFSSSFVTTETENARSTIEAGGINDTKPPIKRVEVPVKILDDTDGEEIAQLVLLRLPESKLNSAILRPVFRVKILEQDRQENREEDKRNDVQSGPVPENIENSSENELTDNNRNRFSRRRRVRINSSQASPTFASPSGESEGRVTERIRPRGRQRIVKARRRTRVNEAAVEPKSEEPIFNNRENERVEAVQGGKRVFGRREGANKMEDETTTPVTFTVEPSTTLKITTIRGNPPTSSKPSNVTRGFYITRSSDEVATTIADSTVTDSPIDSTDYPSTTGDELKRRTNFATRSRVTSASGLETTLPATEETSTHINDGTTLGEVENTTSEIESIDIRKFTSVDYETTPDFSTVNDGIAESFNAMILPTTEESEAPKIWEPSITTFRPLVTREPINGSTISSDLINDPTIPAGAINESTISAEPTDSTTEGIDKFMVTNVDDFTGMVGETLKTSENSNYGSSRNLETKSSTAPMITAEADDESQTEIPVTSQTEIPTRQTTNPVEKATVNTSPIKRGRVRFTATAKPGLRSESTHPRRTTTSTESDVSYIDSATIAPNVDEIRVPSYPSRSRSRGRQRNVTKSVRTDESTAPTVSTSRNLQHKSTTEANRLVTNSAETTRNSYSSRFSSRNFERGQKTTQVDDDVRINSVTPVEFTARSSTSTETYDKIAEPEVATETNDLSTNSPKSTTIPDTSRSSSVNPEKIQKTTRYFEADDVRINSVTPSEFTSTNDVSTEVYDKTGEPAITTEAFDTTATTSFVEITTRLRSRSSLASQDQTRGTTTSIEIDDTAKTSTSSPVDATTLGYDKKFDSSTTLEDEGITKMHLQTTKLIDDPQTTIESDDFTASTTPKISTSAITTESPDSTVRLNSVTVDRYSSSNSVEITGVQSLTTSMSRDPIVVTTTTEIYEKTTDSSEPTSTIDFVTNQEETSPVKSTNGIEATITLTETTTPWAYNRRYNRRNDTKILEDPKTETLNTSSDAAATETIATTTEFYVSDRTATAMETSAANARTNEREEKSTEAIRTIWEPTTIPQVENYNITEATEESNFATTLGNTMIDTLKESTIPADKITEGTKSTTISEATTASSTKSNHDVDVTRRTENYRNIYSTTESSNDSTNPEVTRRTTGNYDKNSYSTVESSYNSVTPDVTRRTTENYDKNSYSTVESSYNSVTPDVTRTTENYNKKSYFTVESSYNSVTPNVARSTTENYDRNSYSTVESSYNSITPDVTRRTTENYNQNSHSTSESSYNSIAPHVPRRTTENYARNSYSSSESSYNSITPSAPREVKRTRGRVRFTNFAANTDESGGIRRPVKQVVVRRRPANSSNQQQNRDSAAPKSRNQIPNERRRTYSSPEETVKKENDVRNADDKLATEKRRNSTASMRRRVVVYRGRPRPESVTNPPTTTTTTTVQSSSLSINDVPGDSGRTRRRKWRKRLVAKRAKADDLEDQSIAESGHFHRAVIDDLVDEELLGSSVSELGDESSKTQDVADGEVNIYKSSGGFLRRPGTLIRPEGSSRPRTPAPGTLVVGTIRTSGPPAPFSKIRPVENVKNDDQSSRAQEVAVTLADPPEGPTSTSGRLPFRTTTRKISTTIAPRTEASVRTTPVSRRRQKPRGSVRTVEVVTARPRRPAIIDYDYYVDDEVRLVVKPELKDKLFVTGKGGIRCLDQGNFAHPTSCKKFITCARMVNGQVLGTEYTCPDKLSFDPVGGICNWSAGLGCEDNSNP